MNKHGLSDWKLGFQKGWLDGARPPDVFGQTVPFGKGTPKGVPFLPVSAPFLTLTSLVRLVAKRNSPVRNPIFSLIVHAYSCYQSENIYSICLLKRVIDPSVLNRSI